MGVFSVFNEKAKKGVDGRKQSLSTVRQNLKKNDRVLWMHAASLGEYEQGLPVLERLKKQYPTHKVLVTFFSPSGYDIVAKRKNIADAVCYLPFDSKKEIKDFINCFKTDIFITIKYEYWYHLLSELKKQGTKVYVVSALFYEKQVFFAPWGAWFTRQLRQNVAWFFHQTEHSKKLAESIGLKNATVTGDTRFDRVKQLHERENTVEGIAAFKGDKKLIVFGSSWQAEEKMLYTLKDKLPNCRFVVAPHDLKRVSSLEETLGDQAILYSEITLSRLQNAQPRILIIDSIGLLSKIYSYANVAVVGGGFHSAGLHNILEAATFGVPVIFGNQYKKNPEADALIAYGGGKSYTNEAEAAAFIIELMNDDHQIKNMGNRAGKMVSEQPNATELILKKIEQDYKTN
jgi:3-deoxy-D-manno-octulosonic-acid transferase